MISSSRSNLPFFERDHAEQTAFRIGTFRPRAGNVLVLPRQKGRSLLKVAAAVVWRGGCRIKSKNTRGWTLTLGTLRPEY